MLDDGRVRFLLALGAIPGARRGGPRGPIVGMVPPDDSPGALYGARAARGRLAP